MKKILVPVDGTMKSISVFSTIRRSFSPKVFELVIMMVHDSFEYTLTRIGSEERTKDMENKLGTIAENLPEYNVQKIAVNGKAGAKIVEYAEELGVSMIVMTKSTSAGMTNSIGTTATYVLRHAHCNVMFVQPRQGAFDGQYRGLVYKKAESVVNLRGQLSLKHSECLLPFVYGKIKYHIDVTRGRVRFAHRSYNPETNDWDICPEGEGHESIEIGEGETADIMIEVLPAKKPDRIRVINRGMKTEAVFRYRVDIVERYESAHKADDEKDSDA